MSRENMCESFEAVDARKKLSEWVEAIDYLRMLQHVKVAHADLFERVRKGGQIYGVTERALYQCRKCGAVEDGVIEIISHYVAEHMEVDE